MLYGQKPVFNIIRDGSAKAAAVDFVWHNTADRPAGHPDPKERNAAMSHTDELDLDLCLSKISRCDEYALEDLYREFAKPIYRFAIMTLQDPVLAEDAMQDTFLRIMSYSGTYRLGTNARAWIFSIARNACMDIYKDRLPVEDDEVINRVPDEHQIDDATEDIVLKEAIGRLTPVEREILSLYLWSGLRQTEIAKVLGMPYIKVRSHYKYAIQKLRKELGVK